MADREKSNLNYERSKGVARAWTHERELVRQGRGTRPWSVKEQKELLKTGRVKGYQGHHMKSVAKHPEYAADGRNIQLLDARKGNNEHLKAHRGDYRNESDDRYNIRTEKIRAMKDGTPRRMNSYELKDKAIEKRGYIKYAAGKEDRSVARKGSAEKADQRAHVKKANKTDRKLGESGRYGKSGSGEKRNAETRKSSYAETVKSTSTGRKTPGSYGKKNRSSRSSQTSGVRRSR